MKTVSLIAAIDRHDAIGKGNALPWHLPADLKRFKALTLGKPILMGRKTAESLGRALPGRRNLVLTRSGRVPFDGMEAVASLDDALAQADEVCVIGGGEIFALTLPMATHLLLTHVDTVVEGADAFFPAFDPAQWRVVSREAHPADATQWHVVSRERHEADAKHAFAFEFVDYVRA